MSFFKSAPILPNAKPQDTIPQRDIAQPQTPEMNIRLSHLFINESIHDSEFNHWHIIERILFVYAKLNPGLGYIQGI